MTSQQTAIDSALTLLDSQAFAIAHLQERHPSAVILVIDAVGNVEAMRVFIRHARKALDGVGAGLDMPGRLPTHPTIVLAAMKRDDVLSNASDAAAKPSPCASTNSPSSASIAPSRPCPGSSGCSAGTATASSSAGERRAPRWPSPVTSALPEPLNRK
jgi:hypothetical protein